MADFVEAEDVHAAVVCFDFDVSIPGDCETAGKRSDFIPGKFYILAWDSAPGSLGTARRQPGSCRAATIMSCTSHLSDRAGEFRGRSAIRRHI
jgi:hypothetical protein